MMEFPTFVYRCPGPHFGPPHTTYGTLDVASEDDLMGALADGWHLTLKAAADAFLGLTEPVPAPADNAPPTRAEMEQQAALLGIDIDRRWSDKTLMAKITAAMTPPAQADDDPI
jgi:hypothetical protein